MKIKWYLFFLIIIIVSFLYFDFFHFDKEIPTRVGILMVGDSRYEKLAGLKNGLKDLGYEPKDIQFIIKNSHDDTNKLQEQVGELVHEYPDIIVTFGAIETTELKKYMDQNNIKIPVVFAGISSPQEIGLINNYKKPGGIFTGINNDVAIISGKRLELLHDLIPTIQQVHVLYDKNTEISRLSLEETIKAAEKLSITIKVWDVSQLQFTKNIQVGLKKDDALLLLPGFRIESLTGEVAEIADQKKLPVMGIYEHEVKMGILSCYGASFRDLGYQSARFVSLIMKGNKPGDIPVELPDSMRFLINKNQQIILGKSFNRDLLYIAEFVNTDNKEGSVRN